RDVLRLDDAKGIECLPNEEIFTELARMGDEKPSTKLVFYKAFFSSQWKFLIHTIHQCMSAKRTLWNEFKTPLFEGMIVAQQVGEGDDEVNVEDVPAAGNEGAASVNDDDVPAAVDELSIPSPTPSTQPPPTSQDIPFTSHEKIAQALEITKLKHRVKKFKRRNKLKVYKLRRLKKVGTTQRIETSDDTVMDDGKKAESQAQIYQIDLEHANKVLSMQDDDIEPEELQEVVKVEKTKEPIKEKDSRALKRINESQEDKAAKKQKIDEKVEELRKHLQIVPNNNDDVYIEATPLALKIITFTTTQLILLVKRKYPLKRFTLDQMLNNVRLEVEEESEVSLELLRRRYALSCNANGKPIWLILGLQKDPYSIVLGPIVPLLLVAPDPSSGELEASVDKLFDEGGSGEQVDQGDSTGDGHGIGVQLVDGSAETIAEDVAPAELQCRKKRKTKVVDRSRLAGAVHHAEVRGEAVPTLPFVSSSISTTSDRKGGDCTELLAGANLCTLESTQRFVISSDSSDPLGVNIAEAEVDYVVRTFVPIMTNATTATPTDDLAAIAKEKLFSALVFGGDSSSAGRSHLISGGISDRTGGDFLVGGIRTVVEPDSNLQIVYVPYWNVTNGFCMDDGGVYREMVEEFPPKFFASIRGIEHDQLFTEFNVRAAHPISLGAKIDSLADQVHKLEVASFGFQAKLSHYENLIERLEEFQDAQLKVANVKLEKLYAYFVDMALHLKEKFYPHLLITISGRRWLLTHGMELAITKYIHSFEYLFALGAATGKAIEKGMQDGLAAGITHGVEGRTWLMLLPTTLSQRLIIFLLCNGLRFRVTTALSVTSISASIIPPISRDDYEIAHTEGGEDSVANDEALVDEGADPFPNVSGVELDV
nr:hypothetical protein [Tanacetum cinerariifolium]